MKIKQILIIALSALVLGSCGDADPTKKPTAPPKSMLDDKKQEKEKPAPAPVAKETTESAEMSNKGIGPITSITLGDIDDALVAKGKEIYKTNCTACHKMKKKYIGPALKGVTERRSPEWIMNMIMNPEEMVEKDPIAMKLLAEYSAPMANQNISEEDARAILELFRTVK